MKTKLHSWIRGNRHVCSPMVTLEILSMVEVDGLDGYYKKTNRPDWLLFGILGRDYSMGIDLMKRMIISFSSISNEKQKEYIDWIVNDEDLSIEYEEKNHEIADDELISKETAVKKSRRAYIKEAREKSKGLTKEYYLNRATDYLTKIIKNETIKPLNMASAFVSSIIQHLKENGIEEPYVMVSNWVRSEISLKRWLQTFDNVPEYE